MAAPQITGLMRISDSRYPLKTKGYIPVDNASTGQGHLPLENVLGNFAKEFSPAVTYEAKELVTFEGGLYRFKTHHAAGAWNASHVNAVDLTTFGLGGFRIVSDDEFLYALTDAKGRIVLGIRKDGTIDRVSAEIATLFDLVNAKVPQEPGKSLIDSLFAAGVSFKATDDYLMVLGDARERIILSIDKNGKLDQFSELAEIIQPKIPGKTLINEIFAEGVSITADDDNLLIVSDKKGRLLFNITAEGVIPQIADALKDKVNSKPGYSLAPKFINDTFSLGFDADHLLILQDKAGRVILDITHDGRLEVTKGIPSVLEGLATKVDKVRGYGLIDDRFASRIAYPNEDYLKILLDAAGRFLAGIQADGSVSFGTSVNFIQGVNWSSENLSDLQKALAENGINLATTNQSDWSNAASLHIQPPKRAIINIEMTSALPQYKGDKKNGYLEFWDLNGNYFKKKISIDVQGNSTQWFPKKNFTIDIFNDDWGGEEFNLKFGDWPTQDSYHIKAWWVDMFRGLGQIYYELLDEVWAFQRGPLIKPWMKALVSSDRLTNRGYGCEYNYLPEGLDSRLDSGAKCHPLGFPVLVHYNGEFYGVSSFAIKKHRKNYHMDKKTYREILIDGVLHANEFWSGEASINWTTFELKNPKTLITMDGSKYDGDNPLELIDSSSPAWTNSKDQKNTQITKNCIKALANVMPQIEAAVTQYGVNSQEVIDLYNQYFDIDNLIDYILFSDVILDTDTGANNVLWATWDGTKWYACPYDIDRSCGMWQGFLTGNAGTALLSREGLPTYYIGQNTTFRAMLQARYSALRKGGIFEQGHLWAFAKRWADAIGIDNYEKEYKRWPNNIVNANAEINTEYWDIALEDGQPVMSASGDWSSDTAYHIGDIAYYGPGNVNGLGTASGYYKFTCVADHSNQPPIKTLKCRDSLWRLYAWFGYQLNAMDLYYNYQNDA